MHARALLFTIYGSYVRHYGGKIDIASLIRLMRQHGFTDGAVRAAVARVTQQGWIEAKTKSNKRYYALTERGRRRMAEAAERIYKFKREHWDGRWRILVYNIPEKKHELRSQIRQELKWLGWGSLSNSAWITPNNIVDRTIEHLKSYRIDKYVEIFDATHLAFSEDQELLKKCWDLTAIDAGYRKFISIYQPRLAEAEVSPPPPDRAFVEKTMLVHEYRKFLFIDPRLPSEMCAPFTHGEDVSKLFLDYYGALHDSSLNFFEEVTSAANRGMAPPAEGRRRASMDTAEITAANEYLSLNSNGFSDPLPDPGGDSALKSSHPLAAASDQPLTVSGEPLALDPDPISVDYQPPATENSETTPVVDALSDTHPTSGD
ncbi:MAG TPA: PaaX family transcriptional regulator C-terminal domain-containing protein [Blastocatellia bacterium]|nr:PaaX family transcriptional regulator C-terminal domain-containing protein [Blastocatellia bacterium]